MICISKGTNKCFVLVVGRVFVYGESYENRDKVSFLLVDKVSFFLVDSPRAIESVQN